ncbi:MAG: hypothetical protein CM15mP74_37060 [Halieaceae bacterium]|nr:MAG: hypothetical protein CM15mP74_37060 [Halieaceae bacterium]
MKLPTVLSAINGAILGQRLLQKGHVVQPFLAASQRWQIVVLHRGPPVGLIGGDDPIGVELSQMRMKLTRVWGLSPNPEVAKRRIDQRECRMTVFALLWCNQLIQ